MAKKNRGEIVYSALFELGRLSGCHQRADRSLFIKGKQFPVCARCTGALIGYIFGALLFSVIEIPWWLSLIFCAILFLDWYIQYIGVLPSSNVRRIITGFLCGFALMQLSMKMYVYIINAFKIIDFRGGFNG